MPRASSHSAAKDTTAKRAAFSPREYWLTSCFAKAFSPPGPSIEPSGGGFFIEPLSSSTRDEVNRRRAGRLGKWWFRQDSPPGRCAFLH